MRVFVALALVGLISPSLHADEPKKPEPSADEKVAPEPEEAKKKLSVGDGAPKLTATKWVAGDEITEFESGKVYVVEFWATWCGPCIVMMPHMADLQEQYKDDGLVVIGFTAKDPNNSEAKVVEFVKKRGPKLGYTFAYADDRETYDAWMRAAERRGIPCSFVVDKQGKIAYIGHPMYLDVVLPKVLAGDWDYEKSPEWVAEVEAEVGQVFSALRGDKALEALAGFEEKYPELSKIPYFIGPKITALLNAGETDEARELAEKTLARAAERDDTTAMQMVSGALQSAEGDDAKELRALSLKAAEAVANASDANDPSALLTLARAHAANGDKAKAREIMGKAIENAPSPAIRQRLEQLAESFEDDADDEKDPN